jgi:TonB family protein
MLLLLVFLGVLIPLLPTPKLTAQDTAVPERLARVMIENKPKPPPPPPKVVQEEKPKVPEKKPIIQPKPPEHPKEVAHQKAQKQLNKITDELADLRQQMDLTPMMSARNLSGTVLADAHAERSMITSKVGAGSGGITSAPVSRNFGGGAGSLVGHDTTTVTSNLQSTGLNGKPGASRTGASGKPARSREEIETVFDRNKGAIYALYNRALRENPALQGKLVLEFTISPAGDVTMCRVISTELNNKDLEEKIVARVRLFHFEAKKDVEAITTTKPIDFFPA